MDRGAWWTLAIVAIVYLYALIDRHMMSLLVEPISSDLGLTDTQFSLAHSFAFAIALGTVSVPAGLLIDRGSRVGILTAGILLWSVMTLLTGLANGFAMLLLCRVGVALGQAVLNPAAYGLIADRFPPERLGLAMGIFGMGPHVGIGIANMTGAAIIIAVPSDGIVMPLLGKLAPWQLAVAAVAVPGFLIAALVMQLPGRPKRREAIRQSELSLGDVAAYFRRNLRSFLLLKLATGFAAMAMYAVIAWAPTLFTRLHGWPAHAAGAALGPLFLIAGAAGALSGGVLGDILQRKRHDGRIFAMIIACAGALPFGLIAPVQTSAFAALLSLGVAIFFASMAIAINPAATMAIMPDRMRGVATSLGVLIVNVVGLGCGPLSVALITDLVLADENALGAALSIVLLASLAASVVCAALCRSSYVVSLAELGKCENGAGPRRADALSDAMESL